MDFLHHLFDKAERLPGEEGGFGDGQQRINHGSTASMRPSNSLTRSMNTLSLPGQSAGETSFRQLH